MRTGPAVLLAAAVLLAGCGGLPPLDDGDTPGPGETPTGADRPTDAGLSTARPPPGVLSLQVADPAELGRAHARAVENRSYVLTSNRTVRYANGTLRSRMSTRVAVDDGPGFHVRI